MPVLVVVAGLLVLVPLGGWSALMVAVVLLLALAGLRKATARNPTPRPAAAPLDRRARQRRRDADRARLTEQLAQQYDLPNPTIAKHEEDERRRLRTIAAEYEANPGG